MFLLGRRTHTQNRSNTNTHTSTTNFRYIYIFVYPQFNTYTKNFISTQRVHSIFNPFGCACMHNFMAHVSLFIEFIKWNKYARCVWIPYRIQNNNYWNIKTANEPNGRWKIERQHEVSVRPSQTECGGRAGERASRRASRRADGWPSVFWVSTVDCRVNRYGWPWP